MPASFAEIRVIAGLTSGEINSKDVAVINDSNFFEAVIPLVLKDARFHTYAMLETITSHPLAKGMDMIELLRPYTDNSHGKYSIVNIVEGLTNEQARTALYVLAPHIRKAS